MENRFYWSAGVSLVTPFDYPDGTFSLQMIFDFMVRDSISGRFIKSLAAGDYDSESDAFIALPLYRALDQDIVVGLGLKKREAQNLSGRIMDSIEPIIIQEIHNYLGLREVRNS